MGGDNEPNTVSELAKELKDKHIGLKTAWYSGQNDLPDNVGTEHFDYIKLGRYVANLGPLDSATTNQRMMKRLADGRVKDITEWFRKNKSVNHPEKTPVSETVETL